MSRNVGLHHPSFPDLIGESIYFQKGLDCPVKPDNDIKICREALTKVEVL
jgi:hypothetical protein